MQNKGGQARKQTGDLEKLADCNKEAAKLLRERTATPRVGSTAAVDGTSNKEPPLNPAKGNVAPVALRPSPRRMTLAKGANAEPRVIPAIWGTTIFHKDQNGEPHDQHEGFDGQPSSEQHIHGSEAPQQDLLASAETVPFVTRTARSHSGSFQAAEPSGAGHRAQRAVTSLTGLAHVRTTSEAHSKRKSFISSYRSSSSPALLPPYEAIAQQTGLSDEGKKDPTSEEHIVVCDTKTSEELVASSKAGEANADIEHVVTNEGMKDVEKELGQSEDTPEKGRNLEAKLEVEAVSQDSSKGTSEERIEVELETPEEYQNSVIYDDKKEADVKLSEESVPVFEIKNVEMDLKEETPAKKEFVDEAKGLGNELANKNSTEEAEPQDENPMLQTEDDVDLNEIDREIARLLKLREDTQRKKTALVSHKQTLSSVSPSKGNEEKMETYREESECTSRKDPEQKPVDNFSQNQIEDTKEYKSNDSVHTASENVEAPNEDQASFLPKEIRTDVEHDREDSEEDRRWKNREIIEHRVQVAPHSSNLEHYDEPADTSLCDENQNSEVNVVHEEQYESTSSNGEEDVRSDQEEEAKIGQAIGQMPSNDDANQQEETDKMCSDGEPDRRNAIDETPTVPLNEHGTTDYEEVKALVLYDYEAQDPGEVSLRKGDVITVTERHVSGWWTACIGDDVGFFPYEYVRILEEEPDAPQEAPPVLTRDRARTLIAEVPKCVAATIAAYTPKNENELKLGVGDLVLVYHQDDSGWWAGESNKQFGWFPKDFVVQLPAQNARVRSSTLLKKHPSPQPEKVPEIDSSSVQVKAEALYDFQTNEPDELSFTKGDTIVVLEQDESGWWTGEVNGNYGLFPSSYVRLCEGYQNNTSPTKAQLPSRPGPDPKGKIMLKEKKKARKKSGSTMKRNKKRQSSSEEKEEKDKLRSKEDAKEKEKEKKESNNKSTMAIAVCDYCATQDDEISLKKGQVVAIIGRASAAWWSGKCLETGKIGFFPFGAVSLTTDSGGDRSSIKMATEEKEKRKQQLREQRRERRVEEIIKKSTSIDRLAINATDYCVSMAFDVESDDERNVQTLVNKKPKKSPKKEKGKSKTRKTIKIKNPKRQSELILTKEPRLATMRSRKSTSFTYFSERMDSMEGEIGDLGSEQVPRARPQGIQREEQVKINSNNVETEQHDVKKI